LLHYIRGTDPEFYYNQGNSSMIHIYLRIDQLGEYSILEHFTYTNVLV